MTRDRGNKPKLMRIGKVAREVDLSVRTLHYYEELGILRSAARTESGYRLYSREAIDLLQSIKRLKRLGLSLAEIRDLVGAREESRTCAPVRQRFHDLLQAHIRRINEQIAELTLLRQSLEQYLEQAERYAQGRTVEQSGDQCDAALAPRELRIEGGRSHDHKPDRS